MTFLSLPGEMLNLYPQYMSAVVGLKLNQFESISYISSCLRLDFMGLLVLRSAVMCGSSLQETCLHWTARASGQTFKEGVSCLRRLMALREFPISAHWEFWWQNCLAELRFVQLGR